VPAFRQAALAAGSRIHFNHTEAGRRLDLLSVPEWLEKVGIGADSRFGQLLQSDALAEYGGEPADQSAINLIWLLSGNSRDSLAPLPGVDEKYHVVGGNDQIVSGMVAQLPRGAVRQGPQTRPGRASSPVTNRLKLSPPIGSGASASTSVSTAVEDADVVRCEHGYPAAGERRCRPRHPRDGPAGGPASGRVPA
jgi:hypothetical protein